MHSPQLKEKETWLAAYLYYEQPWEEFLFSGLLPFVETAFAKGFAKQFFFIRYWERGPHIRLRIKGSSSILTSELKPLLIQHFTSFFSQFPSTRIIPEAVDTKDESMPWFPNNTIQFIPYEPETERYAGETGLAISEEQFQASSKAVLSVIKKSKEWDYTKALGAAIQLHLSFASSMGMQSEEAAGFFHKVFFNWLPSAYSGFGRKNLSIKEIKNREATTLEAFDKTYEEQKEILLPFINTVWEGLQEEAEFEEEWLNTWIKELKEIKEALLVAKENRLLTIPQWFHYLESSNFTKDQQALWFLYDSYIHMTNNRLGIQNRDEGFLGYLLYKSFKTLSQRTEPNIVGRA